MICCTKKRQEIPLTNMFSLIFRDSDRHISVFWISCARATMGIYINLDGQNRRLGLFGATHETC